MIPAPVLDTDLLEPKQRAARARLRYVQDGVAGIRRRRSGQGFLYVNAAGRPIGDRRTKARIASLAIPPAWTDVWISPLANAHIQATGRDARNRKQYRYHPRWHEISNETKFHKLVIFGLALPQIRKQVEKDLASRVLSKRKVLAAVVRLLDVTGIRVGNEEYARTNGSYGLVTLRDNHVEIEGAKMQFRFRGKSGKFHRIQLRDRRLARIVQQCQDIPGQELFQYLDEDKQQYHPVTSEDVNAYLQETTQQPFTAKDFRTWNATLLVAEQVLRQGPCDTKKRIKEVLSDAARSAAEALGNTVTICKKYYIHPGVVSASNDGTLFAVCGTIRFRRTRWLSKNEQALLQLLSRLSGNQGPSPAPRRVS